jgi:hypothetical protein
MSDTVSPKGITIAVKSLRESGAAGMALMKGWPSITLNTRKFRPQSIRKGKGIAKGEPKRVTSPRFIPIVSSTENC